MLVAKEQVKSTLELPPMHAKVGHITANFYTFHVLLVSLKLNRV